VAQMLRQLASGVIIALLLLSPGAVLADHDQEHRIWESRSRFELGRMYEQAGDLPRAEENYRRAVELWPENSEAREGLQRMLSGKTPKAPDSGLWGRLFSWVPGFGGSFVSPGLELIGWAALIIVTIAFVVRVGAETVRLAFLKARGIPLLALSDFTDPQQRLPGLQHQVASFMNDAGLTIYDEKGAVKPDFNLIGDAAPFPQARLLARLLDTIVTRQVQKIRVDVTQGDGLIHCAISLHDSGTGYVRYLPVVSLPPDAAQIPGELSRLAARHIADTILIDLSRDTNTRGLLYQRMGDYQAALSQFRQAANEAQKKGDCGEFYQAFLNLGNLYSFLGLQERSVEAYNVVAQSARNPVTQALIQAAIASSYRWWALSAPEDQRLTYDWLARQAIEKALAAPRKSSLVHYTIACYYSLAGQFEESLRWLREAVGGDLGYLDYAETDPDLEPLRRWLGGRSIGEAIGLRVG
jgi:tetratricopeptide (TPR) repeat protein